MSLALQILTHAIRMIFVDIGTTLRVLAPALALMVVAFAALWLVDPAALQMFSGDMEQMPMDMMPGPGSFGIILLVALLAILAYLLMAVLWHRHVLLQGPERDAGLMPSAGVLMAYFARAFVVALIQVVAAIPLSLGLALVFGMAMMGAGAGLAGVLVLNMVITVILFWLGLRLSLVLPATAIGSSMRFSESWAASRPLNGPIWMLALLLAVFNLVLGLVTELTGAESAAIAGGIQMLLTLFIALVSVSVLTTLYGHLVENRPLP